MFHLPVPLLEKILRPAIVYICLILFLRFFGKRELAQLNPFDLVVLLSLSNTVQNAIIGEDNSVVGGIIGALSLLGVNWLVNRGLFAAPKLDQLLQGSRRVLIKNGRIDHNALKKEILTERDLVGVLHKTGIHDATEVKECALEPSGIFFVERKDDVTALHQFEALRNQLDELSREIRALRKEA